MKNLPLAHKLKELRLAHNYNQDEVAIALNVARQTYSHYETGNRTPSAKSLYTLANFYHIDINDLLQLTIELDEDVIFTIPKNTQSANDLVHFIEYTENTYNKKKLHLLNTCERRLLFYFEQLSNGDKEEMIEIARIKVHRNP